MELEGDGDGAGDRQRRERKERRSYHDMEIKSETALFLEMPAFQGQGNATLALIYPCSLSNCIWVKTGAKEGSRDKLYNMGTWRSKGNTKAGYKCWQPSMLSRLTS